MSGTRSGTYHADRRRRRSFGGCRTDASSAEPSQFSQKRTGTQGFIGNRRSALLVLAKDKDLASAPLIKEILIEAPPAVVFQFLTDPTKIIRWMGIRAEIDPKIGGTYRLHLNGREVILGEYLEVVPDTRLVFTWRWEEPWLGVSARSTRVEIDLLPDGEGTRARLSHRQLPIKEIFIQETQN